MDREDILIAIEAVVGELINSYKEDEEKNLAKLDRLRAEFISLRNMLVEDFEGLVDLEDFCSSYM